MQEPKAKKDQSQLLRPPPGFSVAAVVLMCRSCTGYVLWKTRIRILEIRLQNLLAHTNFILTLIFHINKISSYRILNKKQTERDFQKWTDCAVPLFQNHLEHSLAEIFRYMSANRNAYTDGPYICNKLLSTNAVYWSGLRAKVQALSSTFVKHQVYLNTENKGLNKLLAKYHHKICFLDVLYQLL